MEKKLSHELKIVFGIVFFCFLVLIGIRINTLMHQYSQSQQSPIPFPQQDLAGLDIHVGTASADLRIQDGKWTQTIGNTIYPADVTKIQPIIDSIYAIRKTDIVSKNPNNHAALGIGNTYITLKTASASEQLYIGNITGGQQNYVRLNHENDVFLGSGFDTLSATTDYRDLQVPGISNETQVTAIRVSAFHQSFILEEKDNMWHLGNQVVPTDRARFYAAQIGSIKGYDMKQSNTVDTNNYLYLGTIIITENNNDTTFSLWHIDEQTYMVQSSKSTFTYFVRPPFIAAINKSPTDFTQ